MDAPEDPDLHLQRASADLLSEFGSSLQNFLWISSPKDGQHQRKQDPTVRKLLRERRTDQLIKLLEPFQEWPQLLDPHLSQFLPPLNSAFLNYLSNHYGHYSAPRRRPSTGIIPLPRGICKILYTLCKIRGAKVICRFLTNEPKWLDPMLDAFKNWNQLDNAGPDKPTTCLRPMVWEERYIILLWLSHLMLTPFDLVSISSTGQADFAVDGIELPAETPAIARRIIQICSCHISLAGRERDAATRLLVRLTLRPDMRSIRLVECLIGWALSSLLPESADSVPKPIYAYIGILSFLSGVIASADNSIISPFLTTLSAKVQLITAEETPVSHEIYSSALARKLIIKILRSITLQALQTEFSVSQPDNMLEDVIDQLLIFLGDKDTPVRFAASKGLSIIAVKLESSLAARITEAVIDGLEEDAFWEDGTVGERVSRSNTRNKGSTSLRRNLTAVNPLKWQGLVLTLSHLIYRRSPPIEQLPDILNALVTALRFEQRSSIGTSIGTSVRDAACFGMWALARRYTTKEILTVDAAAIRAVDDRGHESSILQIISNEVLAAATLDPSGNIRRGASAALQEMIGRHPDTIKEGIPLVQVVDYHAVALRSKALLDVAIPASRLDESYRWSIVDCLLDWRGLGSPDPQSRRFAAEAIGVLATSHSVADMETILVRVQANLESLHSRQVAERHGLLLSLAAIINQSRKRASVENGPGYTFLHCLAGLWDIFCSICRLSDMQLTSVALRPDLTAEAACGLISALSLASSTSQSSSGNMQPPSAESLGSCLDILNLSLLRPEERTIKVSSKAAGDIFNVLDFQRKESLVDSWVATIMADNDLGQLRNSNLLIGRIAALGVVFHYFSSSEPPEISKVREAIIDALLRQIRPNNEFESRIAAINSLSGGVLSCKTMTTQIAQTLESCLQDYSVDRRGDIGSLVRLEAIDAVGVALSHNLLSDPNSRKSLLARVCCLAAEKLDKVRFRAWICLQENWGLLTGAENLLKLHPIQDVDATSTPMYFAQILSLYPWYGGSLLEGYISPAGAGSESLLQSSRSALVSYTEQISADDLIAFCTELSIVIHKNCGNGPGQSASVDRIVIPALAVFGFLFDFGVLERVREEEVIWKSLFSLTQKCHYKSTNMHKLEAAVSVYTGLARMNTEVVGTAALRQLCSMLSHPFPKIRNAAADGLIILTDLKELRKVNWSDSPKALKSRVQDIRQKLGLVISVG